MTLIGDMPLVGRVGLLDRMVARLGAGDKCRFVLAGAAGVGKTRLASEVSRAAAGMGYATAHAVATRAAASIPFGAFASLMPEVEVEPGGLLNLLQHAGDALIERTAGGRPLLLVVDDSHLLDDGSAALVHQLMQASSCNLVVSIRTPGSAPDLITTLWKDGWAERLDLTPLGKPEVEELVTATLGGPLTGAGLRWLWETSAGNPLYVRELLTGAMDAGALSDRGDMWVLRLPLSTPVRLADLVATRLAGLPAETAHVVDLLAVGEPLELSVLEAIAPASAIEDAERHGLISARVQAGGFEMALSHPLYGEVRRQQMPRTQLRRLGASLAEALQATGTRRRDDEMRIAGWQVEAGLPGEPALLSRAATTARQLFDLKLAARLAQAALEAGGGVDAGLALAEAEFFSGQHAEAEAVLARLIRQCRDNDDLSRVANARAYNLGTLMGDRDAAAEVVESALSRIVEPGPARWRLLYRRAADRVYSGEIRSGLTDATELLASGDDNMAHRGAAVASVALAVLGRTEEAVATAHRGLETHRRSADPTRLAEAQLIGAVLAHLGGGRLAEAETDATAGYQVALEWGDQDAVGTFCLLQGWVLVERGFLSKAARMFREGRTINQEVRDIAMQRWCLGGLGLAEGMAGRTAQASSAIRDLQNLPPHWFSVLDADLVDRGRAWARVAAGEISAACAMLRAGAERAVAGEQPVAEARLVHDLARLGDPAPAAARLAELAQVVDGALVESFAQHASALARPSGLAIEASARRFEELGMLALAAEAGHSAAATYQGEALPRRATACARRAQELSEQTGIVQRPIAASGQTAALTRREREVAALAASRLSSRDIADRLYLSVRTVDNHLQHVYSKLGVTNREDLAAALGPR